jgi:hypothetical protein
VMWSVPLRFNTVVCTPIAWLQRSMSGMRCSRSAFVSQFSAVPRLLNGTRFLRHRLTSSYPLLYLFEAQLENQY